MDDRFREEDKRIKKLFKEIIELDTKKKKRKLPFLEQYKQLAKSLETIIDVDNPTEKTKIFIQEIASSILIDKHIQSLGISTSVKIYQFTNAPEGFYLLRGVLTPQAQYNWAKIGIQEFPLSSHTNITNLNKLRQIETNDITNDTDNTSTNYSNKLDENHSHNCNNNDIIPTINNTNDLNSQFEININSTEKTTNTNILNLSSNTSNNTPKDRIDYKPYLNGLRWVSLGYHYNWTTRQYDQDVKSVFPNDFSTLCQTIASLVQLKLTPEAAIINYYPLNGQMNGHLDDAEHNMSEPIVSLSLGRSAIFLLGTRTKSTLPISVVLRSGDAIIMSAESRYCYHGVPVIIPHHIHLSTYFQLINCTSKVTSDETNVDTVDHSIQDIISDDIDMDCTSYENYHYIPMNDYPQFHTDHNIYNTSPTNNIFINNHNSNANTTIDNTTTTTTTINSNLHTTIHETDKEEYDFIKHYLHNNRINMNVRRVTRDDGLWIPKSGSGYKP